MKDIINENFSTERALYGLKEAYLSGCTFSGEIDGESPLKEVKRITVDNCEFNLRYPLWHCNNSIITNSTFLTNSRAPIWYATGVEIANCNFNCVKAIRECENIEILNCKISSKEFGWFTNFLRIRESKITSHYAFLKSFCLAMDEVNFVGKYAFQYSKNASVRNSVLKTKDAFWHSENVTVVDSVINGEYLGWYSKNLTLIRCKIIGTQPLCYAENLKMIDCEMVGCDLAFENTTLNATIKGEILSVKNPIGTICADVIKEVIIDDFSRGKCEITTNN